MIGHVTSPVAKHSCRCTIIPPHMSQKIKEACEDCFKEMAELQLREHQRLRAYRASLFRGDVEPPPCEKAKKKHIVKIYDAKNGESLPGKRTYHPAKSSDEQVQDAYKWANKTYEFYSCAYDRDSIDNKGMKIISTVHFGKRYDNAFWNGQQMCYGDGDGRIFNAFTKPIDVSGHELTHGVTQYDINLEYLNESGALNESLSDVFGSMVKQHALQQTANKADWLIGKGLLAGGDWALRSLKAPGTAYTNHPILGNDPQPSTMAAYWNTKEDNGGVHINSGIPNHAFYLVAMKLYEIDPVKYAYSWTWAGKVWYKARFLIPPTATFADFAKATIQVASEILGTKEANAFRYAWSEVEVIGYNPALNAECTIF